MKVMNVRRVDCAHGTREHKELNAKTNSEIFLCCDWLVSSQVG